MIAPVANSSCQAPRDTALGDEGINEAMLFR
jgi:hypothetical protein